MQPPTTSCIAAHPVSLPSSQRKELPLVFWGVLSELLKKTKGLLQTSLTWAPWDVATVSHYLLLQTLSFLGLGDKILCLFYFWPVHLCGLLFPSPSSQEDPAFIELEVYTIGRGGLFLRKRTQNYQIKHKSESLHRRRLCKWVALKLRLH